MITLTYKDINLKCNEVAEWARDKGFSGVYGVPRGGTVPAAIIATALRLPMLDTLRMGCLVIDDICDSGKTAREYIDSGFEFAVLYSKQGPRNISFAAQYNVSEWLVFPWGKDGETGPEDSVARLIQFIGEDAGRDGLIETPKRLLKALTEMTSGYKDSPEAILRKTFDVPYDEMVVVKEIEFNSLCEHHMLPFTGTVAVGYLPQDRVVGLSKIPRLVNCFARRLQVQERMTQEIADAMERCLNPLGVGVVIKGEHSCMRLRGVQKRGEMVTSCLKGKFRQPEVREEFLRIAGV